MMPKFFNATSEIGRILIRYKGALWQVGLISAVLNILMLGGSFFMLLVYDEVLPGRSVPTLISLLVIVTIVYIFQGFLDLIRGRAMIQIGAIFDQKVSHRVFDILTKFELQNGPLREGMQPVRDLDQVRSFISGPGPLAIIDLPWCLLFLGVLFIFHYVLGLLGLAGVIILVSLMLVTDRLTKEPIREATNVSSARYALAESSRRNSETLHALGMAGRAKSSWGSLSDHYLAVSDQLSSVSGRMQSISKTFRMLFQSLMLAAGAALVIDGSASGGIIIAGSILSARALGPVEQTIAQWKGMTAAKQAWTRLETILDRVPADQPVMPLPAPFQNMAVEQLSLGPPGVQKLTVGDVNFTLMAGDALGIIGPSGSGKSTLSRALVGIWKPMRGNVRLDGASLDQWQSDDLGQYLGFMPQQIELFDGTIAQNIARFEPNADPEAIIAAAQEADVHDFIVRLPHGYDFQLGPMGGNLSAGQKQRIALARALYREPFLIVLDEPNSNLDSVGETALSRAMAAARARGAIVIVVAHRPSVLDQVNFVLYMADGRARMFGPKDQVLAEVTKQAAPAAPKAVTSA
jgi:PrtD family type I secretion system ABC transporter